ncbi:hypothetical protein [Paraglaciecola arctica]|uniref:hypothetical protein n=1 Tax=Paraglaciecola arctica TaxID=1128911 RepID=UPI001C07110D|nr:hypothetical protein [Paraglaciecola arctica]MBU3003107.1 hypothetical protein [Paraglaciecola arctica]
MSSITYNSEFCRYLNFITLMASISIIGITCFVLLGTFVEIPDFYRPISSGEATHPLTALLFLLTSVVITGYLKREETHSSIPKINILTFLLASIALIDNWQEMFFLDGLNSYIGAFEYEKSIGLGIQIGSNTSLMFLLLTASYICSYCKYSKPALSLGLCALLIVGLSLVGYVFNEPTLYGHMSLTTVSLGLLICIMTTLKDLSLSFLSDVLTSLSKFKIFILFSALLLIPIAAQVFVIYQSILDARLFSWLLITTPWVITYLASLYILALDDV